MDMDSASLTDTRAPLQLAKEHEAKYAALPPYQTVECIADLNDLLDATSADGPFPDAEIHDLLGSYKKIFNKTTPTANTVASAFGAVAAFIGCGA